MLYGRARYLQGYTCILKHVMRYAECSVLLLLLSVFCLDLSAQSQHPDTGATDACQHCHNQDKSNGKPINHIPSQADCNTCHEQSAWLPARFEHLDNLFTCEQCHNGQLLA
ncbi:MAG: hypothetical protein OEY38_20265, partial [Gammaproteobacteria bacterium]|nr:hypothetical protein [Gammaproteobacteria bacterium]